MTRACPTCRRPEAAPHAPFCSRRCADVDLQRWLAGVYAVPGVEDEAGAGDDGDRAGPAGQPRGGPL
jgi:endogenous inhibitor of DNA gyrase (YacG/DUF329 family)